MVSQLISYVAAQRRGARGLPNGYEPFVIRPLGATTGGVVDPGATEQLMGIAFAVVFLLGGGLLIFLQGRSQRRGRPRPLVAAPPGELDDDTDVWPHTRRFLPWSMAVFMGIIFLVPIDAILASNGSSGMPLSPTIDRILLVAIAIGWLLSLGRPKSSVARPRLRFTRIHAVLIVFIGIAFLSVGVNGQYLTISQELMPAIKKLLVLVTFGTFFVFAASAIRPAEVRPLLKLMVVLGVICSLGTLVERQTHWNMFYAFWTTFHVPLTKPPEMDVYDDIGRLGVVGPTSQPLELATLLSLVLPPAIIFAIESKVRRQRIMWLLAVGLVLAGAVATSRKTSVVAPLAGLIVLIIYRPRIMLRAPVRVRAAVPDDPRGSRGPVGLRDQRTRAVTRHRSEHRQAARRTL